MKALGHEMVMIRSSTLPIFCHKYIRISQDPAEDIVRIRRCDRMPRSLKTAAGDSVVQLWGLPSLDARAAGNTVEDRCVCVCVRYPKGQ